MKGIIWYYDHKERALEILKDITENYKRMQISSNARATTHSVSVYFENGDSWHIAPCKDSCRGMKCNISYIEYGTPEEIIHAIIKPCTMRYPYHAFNYYYI